MTSSMIELPADLAAVLTTVKNNDNGAAIAFPDADEDQLAELARAWDAWNTAAEPRARGIVASARQAAAHMSGAAADGFRQYLEKYAGHDDAHAVTVLDAGLAMARCLHEASGTVSSTKAAMVQQLRSAKEYLDGTMPGAAPEAAAQSEGVRLAVDSCHHHIGQASAAVDSMLRQTAGSVERMDSAGQACALGGAGGPGGGAGGPEAGAPGAGAGGGTGADARPVLAGFRPPEAPRSEFVRAEVPGQESGAACRPGGAALPGLNLAGFTGAVGGTGAQGSFGGAGDPAGAGGSSSGTLGAAGASGLGGAAGGAGGFGGRKAAGGGPAGRARAGAMPSFAGLGMPAGTEAAAAAAGRRAGTAGPGTSGTTRQTLAPGAAGTGTRAGAGAAAAGAGAAGRGPGMGGMHGTGHGGGKKGTRGRRRPGLVVGQAPEEDEVIADSGVHGLATEARAGDRQAQQAHRRWVDGARTEAAGQHRAGAPQGEAAGEEHPPAPADDLLTQLTSVVLGPDAGSGGRPGAGVATGAGDDTAGAGGAGAGGVQAEGRSTARTASPEQAGAVAGPGQGSAGSAGTAGAAPGGPGAGGKPAKLREEGGYQVPSPQLRAALAKLAAAGKFDKPAPAGAARQSAAEGESPGGGRAGNNE
ncbi:hypothetical protein ACFVHB_11435 [Kitasatospora sp. NPDC127111]|uniref:WXG100-like domain-containing protein n=1 Tax=Kitasatospora sp. NPDC127111 TaxID=3345363 RepID=UPI00362FF0A7